MSALRGVPCKLTATAFGLMADNTLLENNPQLASSNMRLFLLYILIFTFHLPSVANQGMFFHISSDKGLSSSNIRAVAQDQYGYIWVATTNGLNRFDAYVMQSFFADSTGQLPSNNIRSLLTDSKGGLWVGTTKGVCRFDYISETFNFVINDSLLGASYVNSIKEDPQGNILLGSSAGLFRYLVKEDSLQNLSALCGLEEQLIYISDIHVYNKTDIFVSTQKKGFYRINTRDFSYTVYGFDHKGVVDCCFYMFGIEQLNEEYLLVGTLSIGLIKFHIPSGTFSWPEKPGKLTKIDDVLFNTVSSSIKDSKGRVWVASYYFGLAQYFPDSDSIYIFPSEPTNPYGFWGLNASCLFEDRQGNIWIGSGRNGLFRFNPGQDKVRFHSQNDADKHALHSGNLQYVSRVDSNTLVLGKSNGPTIFNKATGTFKNIVGHAIDYGNRALEQSTRAIKDYKGYYWIGSHRLGLSRYNPATGEIRVFARFTKPIPLVEDGVTDLLEIGKDSLLLIGFGRPVIFNTKTFESSFSQNDTINPLFQLKSINRILPSATANVILLASSKGELFSYYIKSQRVDTLTHWFGTENPPSAIYNIITDKFGRYWMGTNLGAICVENGKVIGIYRISGSKNKSEEVSNIAFTRNEIWMANSYHVAVLNLADKSIKTLGEREGFTNPSLFPTSLASTPWSTVVIGSPKGLFEVSPDIFDVAYDSPSAYLTAFRVYNQNYQTTKILPLLDKIELKKDQNFFSFDVSAFDFNSAGDIEYSYKLEGFDNEWVDMRKARTGSYTNVPGGKYILKIRARNNNSDWKESPQVIQVIIEKKLWQQAWLYLACVLALAGIFFIIYRNRVDAVRREAKLKSSYEIKLNELENSALRAQMNPHFIFNSLNTINFFINANQPEEANFYITRFSRLIRKILDHSREKSILLSDELELLKLYLELERIRFSERFDYKIRLQEIETEEVEVPPLILQPFVENAILHGILPGEKQGHIQITLEADSNLLHVHIVDNGIGRERSRQINSARDQAHKSHGMDITLKRIMLFNERHGLHHDIVYEDLVDDRGEVAGTKVEIRLHLQSAF